MYLDNNYLDIYIYICVITIIVVVNSTNVIVAKWTKRITPVCRVLYYNTRDVFHFENYDATTVPIKMAIADHF